MYTLEKWKIQVMMALKEEYIPFTNRAISVINKVHYNWNIIGFSISFWHSHSSEEFFHILNPKKISESLSNIDIKEMIDSASSNWPGWKYNWIVLQFRYDSVQGQANKFTWTHANRKPVGHLVITKFRHNEILRRRRLWSEPIVFAVQLISIQ